MDTRFLQGFVAVVERGSIADAARHLDLAPTTLAQQIKALEADFGARLLTRSGRTMRPTEVGDRILLRARELLKDVRDLLSVASDTGLPAGPLRLGATPTALMGLLPGPMRTWMRRHPDIPIYIEPGTSAMLLERVNGGELDAAILVHPAFDLPKSVAWRLLRFELDGIEHIAQLVAEGFGVSVLPDWPVIGPPNPRLKRWKLPAPFPSREVGVAWQRASVRSRLAEAFVGLAAPKPALSAAADPAGHTRRPPAR